jgi:predicted dehydrogenase
MKLLAVCDSDSDRLEKYSDILKYSDSTSMIQSGEIDAVLIATPHYAHTTVGIEALEAGLHVIVEKPISVHKKDCEKLIAAHQNKEKVFAAMFNQRTNPVYQKLRWLIQAGELGKINRINWIITDWYRTESYYASGGWRATWAGEGGGVLMNQCPHQLDLWQWLFGMPDQVRAFCKMGKYHDIEVEDFVTAYMEYDSGATGVFITTTGEAPGTNRLEVSGDRGKVVIEHNKMSFTRNEVPVSKHIKECKGSFEKPSVWNIEIPVSGPGEQHNGVLKNFVDVVQNGAELLAPAVEGIHSVELANSMLLSFEKNETVRLPISADEYDFFLKTKIENSNTVKKVVKSVEASDFSKSF